MSLHVSYAHVRPVDHQWQVEFIAPEGATFNLASTQGRFFDVLVDGKALPLFFLEGSPDGTNFAVGAGAHWFDPAPAEALAKSLTTSVTVAHCSRSALDRNECV